MTDILDTGAPNNADPPWIPSLLSYVMQIGKEYPETSAALDQIYTASTKYIGANTGTKNIFIN